MCARPFLPSHGLSPRTNRKLESPKQSPHVRKRLLRSRLARELFFTVPLLLSCSNSYCPMWLLHSLSSASSMERHHVGGYGALPHWTSDIVTSLGRGKGEQKQRRGMTSTRLQGDPLLLLVLLNKYPVLFVLSLFDGGEDQYHKSSSLSGYRLPQA